MNPVTIEALVIAAAGILSFGQIMLVLVLLSAQGGLRKALAYAAGMSGVLLAIGEVTLLLGSHMSAEQPAGDGPGATAWISTVLGALLLSLALRTWRRPAEEGARPRFLQSLDSATPLRMLGAGALVGAVNVKNLAIYLSAVDVVVRARVPLAEGMLTILAVTATFCLCVLGPIAAYVVGGTWARPALVRLRGLLERHSRALALGAMTFFGVAFLARGIHLLRS